VPASELPSPASLNDVACQYLAHSDSKRNSIYTCLSIIVDEANAYLRPPIALRQLAEITDFNLFLTTTFDSLMKSALDEIRKKETQSLAYSPTERRDLPARKDLILPTVIIFLESRTSRRPTLSRGKTSWNGFTRWNPSLARRISSMILGKIIS
jgi:hypothetical protein